MAALFKRGPIFWAAYWLNGKKIRVSLATQDERKAQRALAVLEDRLERGEQETPDQVLLLDDFMERYRVHFVNACGPELRPSRERTWGCDKYSLRCLIEFFQRQGLRRVGTVQIRHVEAFRDWRLTTQVSVETVNKAIRVGKAAWGWAGRAGFAHENPFKGVKLVKRPLYDPRTLSPFEVRKLFDTARETTVFPIIATAVYAGLRLSELIALEWTDVRFPEDDGGVGQIRVRCDTTFLAKSRKARVVPLAAELATILRPLRSTAGLCFPSPKTGRRRCKSDVAHQTVRCLRRAGIENASLHDLRRTFASLLAADGVPATRIRDYLGHCSLATTEGYYLARGVVEPKDVERLAFGVRLPDGEAPGASLVRRSG
ncbi:MAG TPA: site-specific integrase [Planctomycetota bacterium]|nr:site-specific integrase [Planctomycetota bacterium]